MDDALLALARDAAAAVRAGHLRGAALLDALHSVPFRDRDVWLDEVLGLDAPPDDMPGLPPGTVPYVPCGVDAIVRAVLDVPLRADDVFVDLGAGVGRVALLAHLLTGARALGVELQPHLVERARATAAALSLRDVAFFEGDASAPAAASHIAHGTVFFIYASFSASALERVLAMLEDIARRHRITLCAVGFDVARPWLRARPSGSPELVVYDAECDKRRARDGDGAEH